MAKRNNRIDTEVIALAVTGLSQRAIAKKLAISKTTVSKILTEKKKDQKWTNSVQVVQDSVQEEILTLKKKAHNAITQIIDDLSEDLKNAPLRDKIATLERLKDLFGMPEEAETEETTEILVEIEDASGGDDEKND